MTYASEILADSPLLYWRLGESSGTNANDETANNRDGTYSGTYTQGTTGLLTSDANTAVTVGASTGGKIARATETAFESLSVLAVEVWTKPSTNNTTGFVAGRSTLVSNNDTNYQAWIDQVNTAFRFNIRAGGSLTTLTWTGLVIGETYHLVGTYDGTTARLYVNGVLAVSAAKTGTPAPATGQDFSVGARSGAGTNTKYNGVIDEVAFYDTAPTAARIARHYLVGKNHALLAYEAEVAVDSPRAHWPLAETSGTTMVDVSGNSRNGVIDAGITLNQSSIVPSDSDGAWESGGTVEGGEVAVASWMAPAAALSAEVWFRPTSFAGNGQVLIARADPALTNSAANKPWYLFCTNGGVLQARVYTDAGSTVLLQSASAVFALNTAHHVVLTWDGTTARAYVNGAMVASAALSGVPVTTTTSTKNLTVARDDAAGTYQLTGKVQHAAFYGTALTFDRVVQHYLSGLYGADIPPPVNMTMAGNTPPIAGAFTVTVETPITLDGDLPPVAGAFTLAVAAVDIELDGEVGPVAGAFSLVHVSDLEMDGVVGPVAGTFVLDAEGLLILDGEVPPVVGAFTMIDAGQVILDGQVLPVLGDFDLDLIPIADVALDGQVPPVGGLFDLDNPITAGDSTNRVNGRDRDGIGVATWDPPISEAAYAFLNFDVALAFSEPTISGTNAPPAYDVTGAVKPRFIDRIVIGGRDVTFYRGVPTPFPGFALTEPFGYGPTSIVFPQIAGAFEKPGSGALRWMRKGSRVRIERVDLTADPPEVDSVDYRGVVMGYDLQGGALALQIGGELSGRAAVQNRQPPLFPGTNDDGYWVMHAVRELGLKPHTRTGPNTGVKVRAFGGQSMGEYLNQLLSMAYTRSGDRWTLMPTNEPGEYRMKRKDRETIRGTVYADDTRTAADLHRDIAEEPNRIYMTGVDPDGQRIRFGAYPGLKQTTAPPYPMFDNSAFSQGTTDGDTDTGDGVTVMIHRLVAMKYLDYIDTPGGFDGDVTRALRDLQDDADLNVTGNMNLPTWRALWDLSVTGFSLRRSRILPAAERPKVRQYRRSASGAIIGRNPRYDPSVMKVDRNVDVGSGFRRGQMREWARTELDDGAADNWVGTITFNTGALVDGIHVPGDPITAADVLPARDLRPGDNLWLPLLNGDGIAVHVSGLTISADGTVQATVDTRARDDAEVWEVITRNRESRRSPYREWLRDRRASTVTKDATAPWDEAGGRLFDKVPVPGNTWTVFQVVAGQEGTVRLLDMDTNPNAEYVVAAFGRSITPRRLQRQIGNPLSGPGRKRWEKESVRDNLDERNVLLYVAGSDTEPCGYFPKTKGAAPDDGDSAFSAPLTGRWKDAAGFPYFTAREPVIYVAIYTDRDTVIPGGRMMWNQLEAGT